MNQPAQDLGESIGRVNPGLQDSRCPLSPKGKLACNNDEFGQPFLSQNSTRKQLDVHAWAESDKEKHACISKHLKQSSSLHQFVQGMGMSVEQLAA